MLWPLRARIGYQVARWLLRFPKVVAHPRAWQWMQGQYARMAALGDVQAQCFYGHLLLHRGHGFGAREEGIRLLRQAARAGDAKSAYQLGVLSLDGDARQAPDAAEAARWWGLAADAGHPLAARKLADLYRDGGPGLLPDAAASERAARRAAELGL
ncbi:sel1 repeat family protein [Pseudomonas sp. LFM046]|uniref:tetratricopeptide repeat protein n=1 Tax=Pseudomonas sp. LFM046 TaxID=1608357 RepID=UPI0005CFDCB7|nr:sel1 repeat family protein [Pseudomonas sp. LFM046]